MTVSVAGYLINGAAQVTCHFLEGYISGTLIALYPPWAGFAGSDRCAKWDSGDQCGTQNSCQSSIHGTYTITECGSSSDDITLSMRIRNGNDNNNGTWTCAIYSGGQNSYLATVNLFLFGR